MQRSEDKARASGGAWSQRGGVETKVEVSKHRLLRPVWESRPTVRERHADRCLRGAFRGEHCERRSRGPRGLRRAPPFLPPPPQPPRAIREPGFKADAREPTEAGPGGGGETRAEPTAGGRLGPRPPAAARCAPPCCGGRYRGRYGSSSPRPRRARGLANRAGTWGWGSARGSFRRTRGGRQFPVADPGLRGPSPGVPARDLKGPSPIPVRSTLLGGKWASGRTGLGP